MLIPMVTSIFLPKSILQLMPIPHVASIFLPRSILQVGMLSLHRLIPQEMAIPMQVVSIFPVELIIQVVLVHPHRSTILVVPLF